jgi:hypothetical protein
MITINKDFEIDLESMNVVQYLVFRDFHLDGDFSLQQELYLLEKIDKWAISQGASYTYEKFFKEFLADLEFTDNQADLTTLVEIELGYKYKRIFKKVIFKGSSLVIKYNTPGRITPKEIEFFSYFFFLKIAKIDSLMISSFLNYQLDKSFEGNFNSFVDFLEEGIHANGSQVNLDYNRNQLINLWIKKNRKGIVALDIMSNDKNQITNNKKKSIVELLVYNDFILITNENDFKDLLIKGLAKPINIKYSEKWQYSSLWCLYAVIQACSLYKILPSITKPKEINEFIINWFTVNGVPIERTSLQKSVSKYNLALNMKCNTPKGVRIVESKFTKFQNNIQSIFKSVLDKS